MKGKSEMDGYTNLKQFHQVTSVCSTCSVPLPNGGLRVTHATLSIATPLNTIEKCAQKCLSVPQQKCISFSYLGSAAAPTQSTESTQDSHNEVSSSTAVTPSRAMMDPAMMDPAMMDPAIETVRPHSWLSHGRA